MTRSALLPYTLATRDALRASAIASYPETYQGSRSGRKVVPCYRAPEVSPIVAYLPLEITPLAVTLWAVHSDHGDARWAAHFHRIDAAKSRQYTRLDVMFRYVDGEIFDLQQWWQEGAHVSLAPFGLTVVSLERTWAKSSVHDQLARSYHDGVMRSLYDLIYTNNYLMETL